MARRDTDLPDIPLGPGFHSASEALRLLGNACPRADPASAIDARGGRCKLGRMSFRATRDVPPMAGIDALVGGQANPGGHRTAGEAGCAAPLQFGARRGGRVATAGRPRRSRSDVRRS